MADEDKAASEESMEVDPVDDEQSVRREILEIRPKDPSPEVFDPEPPELTIGGVLGIVKKKGLIGALSDDAWAPHVHLVMLLVIITMIAIGVAIIQLAT
jgi:hypothetical protein